MALDELIVPGSMVTLQYSDLLEEASDLTSAIEQAYGPKGLGILLVSGVPNLLELRRQLLPLAARLAALPEEARRRCEDPLSRYNFGWSHGRETLAGGFPDTNKGSFYANPLMNSVTDDPALISAYPTYCRPNVWPREELPQLEEHFQQLGRLIIQVGELLAGHCDLYVARRGCQAGTASLRETIRQSPCPKARLLHYFPPRDGETAQWCGWHTDHGSLTGLTSAMFLLDGREVENPDPTAGLYIRNRQQAVVQARIPAGSLAFQMGEASQVQLGGLLQATPHYVKGPGYASASVSRNTFAVFMQPRWDAPMSLPPGVDAQDLGIGQWKPGMSFGSFSEATMEKYYGVK